MAAEVRLAMKYAAGRTERVIMTILGGAVLFFLVAPMLIVVLASFDPGPFFQFPPGQLSLRWFGELLRRPEWRTSLEFTLLIAALTGVLSMVIGTLAGVALGRMRAGLTRASLGIIVAPLVVPTVVLAVALYQAALRYGLIGSLVAFVAVNTVLTAPLVTLFVSAAVRNIDPRLEFASLSAGAGPWRTLVRITVPLAAPAALAGGALSLLLTLDEVVISSFLVAPGRVPVAVRMFQEVQHGTTPLVTAMASVLILSTTLLAAVGTLLRAMRGDRGQSRPDLLELRGIGPRDRYAGAWSSPDRSEGPRSSQTA
jgi:putative spermidine/putrescine transport system permease protein